LRFCRLCRFGIAQLELLDSPLDSSEYCQQMELLLNRVNARLELDRFPAWSLGSNGDCQATATHFPLNSAVLICDKSFHVSSPMSLTRPRLQRPRVQARSQFQNGWEAMWTRPAVARPSLWEISGHLATQCRSSLAL